jgi:hypothetical protein
MTTAPQSVFGALNRSMGRYPDTEILFDDTFENGFAGWQELHTDPSVATSGPTFAPLGLSHPSVPGPCLSLVTGSVADPGIHSQSIAMKRLSHREVAGIIDFEVWFSYGGESQTGFAPRYLHFMIDEMRGGTRHFWKARWRNVNEADTSTRPRNWYLSSQGEDIYVDTTLVTDFPWNGNKGSESYMKFSVNTATNTYGVSQANGQTLDFSAVSGVTPPGANGSGTFDDPLFNNGLNFMVGVLNRGAQSYMGWMACTRMRATLRSA